MFYPPNLRFAGFLGVSREDVRERGRSLIVGLVMRSGGNSVFVESSGFHYLLQKFTFLGYWCVLLNL